MATNIAAKNVPMISDRIRRCLKAPGESDDRDLEIVGDALRCTRTGTVYPFMDGVPSLLRLDSETPGGVTERIKAFYEENPFPNYDGLEEFAELVNKGMSNPFSANLLKAIDHNKLILECGCGTGQLSHFLQLNNNHVLGVDLSLGSLGLARTCPAHNL